MRHIAVLFVLATTAAVAAAQTPNEHPNTSRSVWDGVYTAEQAKRGEEAYRAHCSSCHHDDLSGYNNLLVGERFMEKYREASLGLFFNKTRDTMPRNAPGTLDAEMYVDIVSYILKFNEFPAGSRELALGDVPGVRLEGKDGPAPVPNFSLVQVFGCLVQRGNDWHVTNATEPVRTANPQPEAEEVAVSDNRPAGTTTFELLSPAAYEPAKSAGRIIELRGFLIRRPKDNHRINVTSIVPAGPACGQ